MKHKFKYLDKYFTYFINNPNERGMLKNVPLIIVDKMLEYQVEQGNKLDITVFIENSNACKKTGGFSWSETKEGNGVWNDVLSCDDYDSFFEYWENTIKEAKRILGKNDEEEIVVDNKDKISADDDLQSVKDKLSKIINSDSEIFEIGKTKSDNIDCIKFIIGCKKELTLKNKVLKKFAQNYDEFSLASVYKFIKDSVNTLEWEDKPWLEIKHNRDKRAYVKFEQEFNDIGELVALIKVVIKTYNTETEDFEIEKELVSKGNFNKALDEHSPEFYEILSNFIK